MIRLLQISDPHFGTQRPEVVAALTALSHSLAPDLVVLSGDITQRARRTQFEQARQFTQQLMRPVLAVPGNHDIPLFNLYSRLFRPYGNYRRAFGDDLEPEFQSAELLVIGVNSSRPGRHKDGEVSQRQIDRVRQRLEQASPQQLRVVVQHHPVRAIEESDTSNLLIGRERAIPAWVDAGADLILGGHIHLPYALPLTARTGELGRQAWALQAGTAVSSRVRGEIPNSVNLVRYNPDPAQPQCVAERWDYNQQSEQFEVARTHLLPLSRSAAGCAVSHGGL
ncbi:MAG: metallophosphoesterase family protein [Pseudomonas sp.]